MIEGVVDGAGSFVRWRERARDFLRQGVPPADAVFARPQASLFAAPSSSSSSASSSAGSSSVNVPRRFLELARLVCCHTDEARFDLLYRLLWRLQHQRALLDDAADVDVNAVRRLEMAVHRDIHKMYAFVRFRETRGAPIGDGVVDGVDDGVAYVAFHRPDFFIVEEATPFFARRFPEMRWAIFTPRGSALFSPSPQGASQQRGGLTFGAAVHVDPGADDDVEDLWRTYYAAIYNPARAMPRAMRAEMPQKHWRTLPEARLIPGLLQDAQRRTRSYVDAAGPDDAGARPFLPHGPVGLAQLRDAAVACTGCPLAQTTATSCPTQVVFGEGPDDARLVLVGEQPGDEEDVAGRPFVGPAGRLLDALLLEAGIDRGGVYLTNTVKHFRHERQGKRRIHQRPTAHDVTACRPWLEREIAIVQPTVIVCLGQTAARAVVDPRCEVGDRRGAVIVTAFAPRTVVTWHPAAILRAEGERAATMRQELVDDLRLAAGALAT